jgi:hypothetical protein
MLVDGQVYGRLWRAELPGDTNLVVAIGVGGDFACRDGCILRLDTPGEPRQFVGLP